MALILWAPAGCLPGGGLRVSCGLLVPLPGDLQHLPLGYTVHWQAQPTGGIMRYITEKGARSGFWYVYDSMKGEFVWRSLNESVAVEMAADINGIHGNSPTPAGVSEDVLERLMQRVHVLETMADGAARSLVKHLDAGDQEGSEVTKAQTDGYRQQANDLRVVLAAFGRIEV